MTITLMEEISAALDTVTEHEMERASSKLEEVNKEEKKLGTVYDPATVRLYALSWRLANQAVQLKYKSEWESMNLIDRQEQLAQSTRLASLAIVCHELCMSAAKFEVGYAALKDDVDDDVCLHLRANFVLVSHRRSSSINIIQAMLGGGRE